VEVAGESLNDESGFGGGSGDGLGAIERERTECGTVELGIFLSIFQGCV
jgi:hypothetical protein